MTILCWLLQNFKTLTRTFHEFAQQLRRILGFTGKFMKELRISDYQRLKKYFLWDQQASKIVHNS